MRKWLFGWGLGLILAVSTVAHAGAPAARWNFGKGSAADLAVFNQNEGKWFVRSLDASNNLIRAFFTMGFKGTVPVAGDFDGDGTSDIGVFNEKDGKWYLYSFAKTNSILWGYQLGFAGSQPVTGDFDGDGADEIGVYYDATGQWYIRSLKKSTNLVWGVLHGFKGTVPAVGDFNGDGADDLGVFNPDNATWYARSVVTLVTLVENQVILWNHQWGTPDAIPVVGDYNGDGRSDLGVFNDNTGRWFIQNLSQPTNPIVFNLLHGFKDGVPVAADFNGDGSEDLGVFNDQTGRWFIRSATSPAIIAWDLQWGFKNAVLPGQLEDQGADIGVPGSGGGFLWKPVSESNGKLAVLLPASYTGRVKSCYVADENGNPIEGGRYSGVHNGGREHYRFTRTGGQFGNNKYVIAVLKNGALNHWLVRNGSSRTEF